MLAQRRMQRKTMNDSTTSDLILVQSVGRALSSSCTLVGGVSSERRPSIMIAARVDWGSQCPSSIRAAFEGTNVVVRAEAPASLPLVSLTMQRAVVHVRGAPTGVPGLYADPTYCLFAIRAVHARRW